MKKSLIVGMACLVMNGLALAQVTGSGSSTSSTANEVTSTTELYMQATASFPSCSQWHVSGTCFFLHCSIKCKIRTSVRYSHFAPDLVVSTYQDLDNHPWPEVGIPIGKMMLQGASLIQKGFIGDGAGTMTKSSRRDMNAKYRDADAIGHPGGAISSCPSAATTFMPYFSSFTDASAWRNFLPADMWQLASWVPGLREIGSFPLNTWGNVMPRTGWHTHQHDVKVAAVLSQRVADIVTQTGQPHVYDYLSSNTFTVRDGDMVWDPPSAKENSEMGGLWQLSAPKKTGSAAQCHVFGDNDSVSPVGYGDHSTTKTESYAYTLWRPYACCRKRGIFLYAIIWGKW